MSAAVIEVEGVRKVYRTRLPRREVLAVHDLNLTIERGSVVAFVGPNGAGKTTTIYMLLGLLNPDLGSVSVFGEPPGSVEARRKTGFMSEIFHTYPFHTARQAMRFYGRLAGAPAAGFESEINKLLYRLGLGAAANRKVGTFSKGMMQRLGMAQVLLHGPELLVLDEPTTGLDPEGRRLVAEIIAEQQAKGTTVFLSSHILSDVERSCDHVAMLRQGELVLSKSLAELVGKTDDWEVEVTGLDEASSAELVSAGFAVSSEDDERAVLSCTTETKNDLLRRLIDMPVTIGAVRSAGQTLEDLYMEHTEIV